MFAFSATVLGSDGKGCSEAAKKACTAAKTDAGCSAAKSSEAAVTASEQAAVEPTAVKPAEAEQIAKTSTDSHVCPDVAGKSALQGFHESMHPLHMALSENNFDAIRSGMPNLLKASKAVENYKCDGYDKCPKEVRSNFENRKKDLLEAVSGLKTACKGKDDAKVTAAFDKMHEAYITFANTCSH